MSEHTSFRYPYILIHAPFQNPSIKTHPRSIYQFPYSPSISSLFTTRIDRNPHHHRSHPISRWSIIHDGIESIAFPPRQTPIIIFITSPRNARFSFLEFFFLPPISHPSSRRVSSYVFRSNLAARKGRSRSTSSSSLCGASRGCLSRFMFTRHDPSTTRITSCLGADALSRGAKVKQVR